MILYGPITQPCPLQRGICLTLLSALKELTEGSLICLLNLYLYKSLQSNVLCLITNTCLVYLQHLQVKESLGERQGQLTSNQLSSSLSNLPLTSKPWHHGIFLPVQSPQSSLGRFQRPRYSVASSLYELCDESARNQHRSTVDA